MDIFVCEPFDFAAEHQKASMLEIASGLRAPFVTLATLLEMKRAAAWPQDLIDIQELERLR